MNIHAAKAARNSKASGRRQDRVRVQFERPPLEIELDPASAPGLDWESVWDVLGAESFDVVSPVLERPVFERTPYAPRPWLDEFRTGPVARFKPDERGRALVARSRQIRAERRWRASAGRQAPKEIAWDGP
jgi:hypothetical protein